MSACLDSRNIKMFVCSGRKGQVFGSTWTNNEIGAFVFCEYPKKWAVTQSEKWALPQHLLLFQLLLGPCWLLLIDSRKARCKTLKRTNQDRQQWSCILSIEWKKQDPGAPLNNRIRGRFFENSCPASNLVTLQGATTRQQKNKVSEFEIFRSQVAIAIFVCL